MKVRDWINKINDRTFVVRDWADGKSFGAIGDGTTPDDKCPVVAFAVQPNDYHYVSLDTMLLVLSELYGKDTLISAIQSIRPYEEIKDFDLRKSRSCGA